MKKYKFRAFIRPLNETTELKGFVYESENVISLYTTDGRLLTFLVDEVELELCKESEGQDGKD